ncbi:MAG: acyltransferase [Chloroflexota bacterium]
MITVRQIARSLLDPAAYRRITSGGGFVPEVDGIRFVAIAAVILLHLNTHFKRTVTGVDVSGYIGSPIDGILGQGATGVEIFFALSGFILALPFCRAHTGKGPRVGIGRYYLRRLTRLEPPFILSTLVIFFLLVITGIVAASEAMPHLLATLTYTHSIIFGAWSTINPVTWSLETEVQFYIIAPLLALVFVIRDARMRAVGVLMLWFLAIQLPTPDRLTPYNLQYSLISYLHVFLIGFFFCELYVHHPWVLQGRHRLFDLIGIATLLGVFAFGADNRGFFDVMLLVFMISVFRSVTVNRVLTNRWVTAVGGACYSLYLLHYAVIFMVMTVTGRVVLPWLPATWLLQFGISLVAVLVIGMLFFRWCERPFMRPTWPAEARDSMRRSMQRVRAIG